MEQYKIIATDLDGTLLSSRQTVSPENERAIEELTKRGIHFVPCSGRSYSQMPEVVKSNPHARYYIFSGGSVIFDKESGKRFGEFIPKEKALSLCKLFKKYDTNIIANRLGSSFIEKGKHTKEAFSHYREDESFFNITKFGTYEHEDIEAMCRENDDIEMFCVLFANDEERELCRREIEEIGGLRIVSSTKNNLEIISASAGKGNAITKLSHMLSFTEENVICIGDSINDLSMIEVAGLGLAVENAMPELKARADRVIVSNDEHVMKYILENIIN